MIAASVVVSAAIADGSVVFPALFHALLNTNTPPAASTPSVATLTTAREPAPPRRADRPVCSRSVLIRNSPRVRSFTMSSAPDKSLTSNSPTTDKPQPNPELAPGANVEPPKQYRPADHESRIWNRWEASKAFHADPERVLSGEA